MRNGLHVEEPDAIMATGRTTSERQCFGSESKSHKRRVGPPAGVLSEVENTPLATWANNHGSPLQLEAKACGRFT